ncbi:hypothetical protein EYF80_019810 [Liparis tanakae]|uniref:Uncharacterized protein n=1 Tax=Liparis tanakae TaxID=230148 RepID=A0A4Z2HW65_9TELE|nr:hypothetical protein EYF80_019810 [Liparis tanakae]
MVLGHHSVCRSPYPAACRWRGFNRPSCLMARACTTKLCMLALHPVTKGTRRLHAGGVSVEGPGVVAVLATVDDEHRVAERVLVVRRALVACAEALRQTAGVLPGALLVVQAAAPPEAAALGAVVPRQREAAAAEGDPGAGAGADAEGAPGEHRGAADGSVAALAVLTGPAEAGGALGQVHQAGLGVTGHQLLVGPNVPLQLGAVDGVDARDAAPIRTVVARGRGGEVIVPEELLDAVVDVGGVILGEDSERPGESEERGQPEDVVGEVPRVALRVGHHHDVLLQVDVLQVHALPGLHVVIQALVVGEKTRPLREVGVLGLHVGKTEALGEAHLREGRLLQGQQLLGHVFDATVGVVVLGLRHVGVDAFVVNLGAGVRVSVAVARDLPRPADVVVADGLPPDAGFGLLHPLDPLVDALRVHLVLQLVLHVAVPGLHEVDQVEHAQQRQGDVDVAIRAGAVMVHHGLAFEGAVEGEAGHLGDVTPDHRSHATVHEDGQEQAFPKTLPAQRLAQRLLLGSLLLSQSKK